MKKKIFCNFCQNELTYNKYTIVEEKEIEIKIIVCEMCKERKIRLKTVYYFL